ncbi:MAG: hypothetical protein CMF11_01925 [Idiomarina sp.]|nr:hypothetical protein [Idiomarina sp.]
MVQDKMNFQRRFGIEIEFKGNRAAVCESIQRLGVACLEERYNHNTRTHWKIVTDASLGYDNAGEVVSPILQGEQGLRELELVCQGLEDAGARVDRQCGLHIHLDCRDMSVAECQTVFKRYSDYEHAIDRIMPRSRRGNARWCGTIAHSSVKRETYNTKESLSNAIGRYHKVNLTNIASRGSIEFRQHSGTTNYNKIYNWLNFLQQFVASSIQLTGVARTVRRVRSKQRWYNQLRTAYENVGGSVTYSKGLKKWRFETGETIFFLTNAQIQELYPEGSSLKNTPLKVTWQSQIRLLDGVPPQRTEQYTQDDSLTFGLTPETIDWLQRRANELS